MTFRNSWPPSPACRKGEYGMDGGAEAIHHRVYDCFLTLKQSTESLVYYPFEPK